MLTNEAFSGYAKMRLDFLLENSPELVREMEEDGSLSTHLEDVQKAVNERRSELEPILMQELGATEELKSSDWGTWYSKASAAQMRAREMAIGEVVEAR